MIHRVAFAAGLVATLIVAPGRSTSAQSTAQNIDRVVELPNGHRIAFHCAGQGKFTVVLETGDGGHRAHMAKLFAALSKHYRVCDYDRRNIGQSSSAPVPRKAAELAADPFDALAAVGITGPRILFGTSMGGLLVRSYAAIYGVAGFVTSNQPGTAGEWTKRAHPFMSPTERAADLAWMAGDNNEHIDTNDVSRVIQMAAAPTVPRIIMISTERFQCPAAGTCGPTYRAFVAASKQAARTGSNGKFRVIDGNHDLYVTHLDAVLAAIDEVAATASTQH
jgi:pimeloyl-ACP methyl ester carboxylesterase